MFKSPKVLQLTQEEIIALEHISLKPTRLGISLLLLSIGVWIGAANYQVNVAYLICFWMICFTFIASLLTIRQLQGLNIQAQFSEEIFAGETAQVHLHFSSMAKKRTRLFWWRSETSNQFKSNNHATEISQWQHCQLSGSHTIEQIWSIPVMQRGYFPRPLLIRLATSAPFGIFTVECHVEWQTESLVYPSPLIHQEFGFSSYPDPEQTPQQTAPQGEDIAYLKPHQEHSSLQHIVWKVYAKRGELMDKVFDEPPHRHQNQTISYLDYPSATPKDKLASLLTYRVLMAERTGIPYTLHLPTTTIAPQNNQRQKCLNALALI